MNNSPVKWSSAHAATLIRSKCWLIEDGWILTLAAAGTAQMLLPPSGCHHSWLVSPTRARHRQKDGHPPWLHWMPRSWCRAVPEKQAKSSSGNGERGLLFFFLCCFYMRQTLIYLYRQHMMNGYQREYDSLSSVNAAKILCYGDYILEQLCSVFFILPP